MAGLWAVGLGGMAVQAQSGSADLAGAGGQTWQDDHDFIYELAE